MQVFLVPKGDNNINMVYYGTSIGFNDELWDSHLLLTTVRNTLRALNQGTFISNRDVG